MRDALWKTIWSGCIASFLPLLVNGFLNGNERTAFIQLLNDLNVLNLTLNQATVGFEVALVLAVLEAGKPLLLNPRAVVLIRGTERIISIEV